MKILVTGGAGFIGSNFIRYMLRRYTDVEVVNFDWLTYAGNLENLADVEKDPRYTFIRGDIADVKDVRNVFEHHRLDAVVNFAAESHVDRSLHLGAERFVLTNVLGTQVLLDAAREYGVPRYLQVSTDEVYGSLGATGRFTEETPLAPNNPYSATKASADFLVRAAHRSHGMDTVITRCSNNFGPYQFPEKLIPLMIANAMENKPLPVYGDGLHVRDWIYVLDHCAAIDVVLRKGRAGEVYNIGGQYDVPNIEVVKKILRLLGKPESLITFVKDRPGHDRRYAMAAEKIRKELGWTPAHSFDDALRETIEWFRNHADWLARVRSGDYVKYYERMYANR
jgi:dTDP-glucose 4,6-dehydratase